MSRLGSALLLLGLVYSCPGNPSRAKETWSWVFVPTSGEETAFFSGIALLVECNPGAAPGRFASSWDYEANPEERRGTDTEKNGLLMSFFEHLDFAVIHSKPPSSLP